MQAANACSPTIVPIRPGSGPPLVLVHSALGSTGYYASLGRELPPEVPVYGLNSIGLFGGAEPVRSFEAMAERYLAACRELYPKGPWILGGHSMGAYIAFEMCLQAGESRIPRCLVIDQAGPAYAGMGTLISNADVAEAVASLISVIASLHEQALPAPLEVIRDTLASADEAGQLRHIAGWLRELRFLPQAASDAMAEAFLNVLMANCIAETQWSPGERTYAGELSIIRARDSLHEPEAYAQWQQYCSRQIQAREISGSHATIMSRPYVLELAARLCELLGTRSAAIVPANLEERAECFPQMTT